MNIHDALNYIFRMHREGKKITQEHIDRYIEKMVERDKSATRYKKGGLCKICKKSWVEKEVNNSIGKFKWYLPDCECIE